MPARRAIPAIVMLGLLLLLPAIHNGFPLIFPDSGTYLAIGFGPEYALDRSSFYGFLLKPLLALTPGLAGLWIAIAVQAFVVALALWAAAAVFDREGSPWKRLAWITPAALLTALPWHAGQFMPDAFSGILILLVWLAALRAPLSAGTPLLWVAVILLTLVHYTHLPLLLAAAGAAILAQRVTGLGWRACLGRGLAALGAAGIVAGAWIATNGMALGRWTVSPTGSVFIYARLNEDGLMGPWLDGHCGRDAPAPLCAIRANLPRDSQEFLWTDASPVSHLVWRPANADDRWPWVDMMGQANRGAILDNPGPFLGSSLRGFARQFAAFQPLDDECPAGCRNPAGGITYQLSAHRPETVPALLASRQSSGTSPKALVRAIVWPIELAGLILLIPALLLAWRRRDDPALGLIAAVGAALIVNAAVAGALSDVHDRYQSRLVWLAPFVLLIAARGWRERGARSSAHAP